MEHLLASVGLDLLVLQSSPVTLSPAIEGTLAGIYTADREAEQGQLYDSDHKFEYLRSWPIEKSSGELLFQIVRYLKPTRILELGTSFGASTIYMAAALQANQSGIVITVEVSKLKHAFATRNFLSAGLQDFIVEEHRAVDQYLKHCQEQFDLVLLDCDRSRYHFYLEQLMPHIHAGTLLIADNAIDRGADMKLYVDKIEADTRFVSALLPLGDGLFVSRMM